MGGFQFAARPQGFDARRRIVSFLNFYYPIDTLFIHAMPETCVKDTDTSETHMSMQENLI